MACHLISVVHCATIVRIRPLFVRPTLKHLALVSLFALVACGERGETGGAISRPADSSNPPAAAKPAAGAPVRTDRSSYVLTDSGRGPEATIVATLRAPDDRPVYIVNCNGATGVSLQRRAGDEWVPAWLISMNACLSPPIVVPPGGEHTASIYVHENSGAVLHPPRQRMIESGTYRVVWTGVLTAYDPNAQGFGPDLPLEQRVSAPITIEVP